MVGPGAAVGNAAAAVHASLGGGAIGGEVKVRTVGEGKKWKEERKDGGLGAGEDAAGRKAFGEMDANKDGKLSYEEWKAFQAKEEAQRSMYSGPRFAGEAVVPVEKELDKLGKRIERQMHCKKLILYLVFLGIYVAIMLCYPFTTEGEMISEIEEWTEGQTFGEGDGLADVSSVDDFWQWFEEAIIDNLWDGDGIVLGFNTVVSGVTLAQRRKEFTTNCNTLEATLFLVCPQWPHPDEFDLANLDESIDDIFPATSPYEVSSRKGFILEEFPLYRESTDGKELVSRDQVIEQKNALQAQGWLDLGTAQVDAVIIFYNSNTRLFVTMQTRFLISETGGVDYDILSNACVANPLSSSIREAGSPPWQFRVTLEIIFVISITLLVIKEIIEIVLTLKLGVKRAKAKGHGVVLGLWKGLLLYLGNFWNLVDITLMVTACITVALQINLYVAHKDLVDYMNYRIENNNGVMQGDVLTARFIALAVYTDLFEVANAACMLTAFFRLFKYLQFHPRLGVVSRTISRAYNHLVHFGLVFLLVAFGYSIVGWIMFASRSPYFRTLQATIASVVQMLTTGVDYSEFSDLIPTRNYSWWSWIPLSMYYFGVLVIAAMLMLNIFLGIMLSTYDELHSGLNEKHEEEDTLAQDFRAGWFLFKKKLGIVGAKPRASKVDPMVAYLTPTDAEAVRPALETIFNELSTVHAVLADVEAGRLAGVNQMVPYRSLSSKPDMVAVFNYSDLAQVFTDQVAMYLWALYGPGAPPEEDDGEAAVPEDTDAENRSDVQSLHENQERLQQRLGDLDAKLDILLATLVSQGAVVSQGTTTPRQQPPTEQSDASQEQEQQYEGVSNAMLSQANAHKASDESKLADAPIGSPRSASSSGSSSSSSSSGSSSSSTATIEGKVRDSPAPVNQTGKVETRKVEAETEASASSSQEHLVAQLMEKLLESSGYCPLQKIKNECAQHTPPIDFELAKAQRRGLGIIQRKMLVTMDGGSRKQLIRVWKKATTKEDLEVLQKSLQQ